MDLATAIARLDELDLDHTIYAEVGPGEASATTRVIVEPERADGQPPGGFAYFLEVDAALEAVEVWSTWRDGRAPTLADKLDAVIHHAVHDAYLPAEGDAAAAFDRVAPQVVQHRSGYRVQIGDRYHVEYVVDGVTARCEADLGSIPVVIYLGTLAWSGRPDGVVLPDDATVVAALVEGLQAMDVDVELRDG